MSTAVVSTSAALGRPFLFAAEPEPELSPSSGKKPSGESPITQAFYSTIKNQQSTILSNRHSAIENAILPASRLEIRPAPEMAPSGIPALDALIGGLPRGCLTELCGPASSGRTGVMLAALAAATRRGEYCALIDASDALDPHSLAAAEVDLDRLLWVRCADQVQSKGAPSLSRFMRPDGDFDFPRNKPEHHGKSGRTPENSSPLKCQSEHRLEQVLRTTDLLLESGGFGLILLDLADIPHQSARRIPMTTWFRFRRAVEHKPTILLAIEQQPIAGSCSSLLLQLGSPVAHNGDSIEINAAEKSAAQRRKNAAHGASRGDMSVIESQTPEGRKKNYVPMETTPPSFPSHAHLLTELEIRAELIRSRLDRKPARSVAFETKTAWAG